MTPTVSVVIAAYNAAAWIGQTLDSVLAQTYRDFEVIVVDDGSTDETAALVATYGPPVRHVRKPNAGTAAARNTGVREASGRYVAFLDHDDLWEPCKLEAQMRLFGGDPTLAWVYADAIYFDSDTGRVLHRASDLAPLREGEVLADLLMANFIPFASAVVKRDVLLDAGGFNEAEAYKHIDDWDLWLRIAPRHPVRYVAEPLVRYRVHATQATQQMNLDRALRNRIALLESVVTGHDEKLGRLRDRAMARVYVAVGRQRLNREERAEARQLFRKALRLYPRDWHTWVFLGAAHLPRPLLQRLGGVRRWVQGLRRPL
jgi:glycosyltransferase involved in cell wall biosynthesis